MKEIKIQELENIKIGSAENKDAATGCTVILCEQGMAAGLLPQGLLRLAARRRLPGLPQAAREYPGGWLLGSRQEKI